MMRDDDRTGAAALARFDFSPRARELTAAVPAALAFGAGAAVACAIAYPVVLACVAGLAAIALHMAGRTAGGTGAYSAQACDAGRLEAVEDRIWALSDQEARYRELLDRQQDVILGHEADGAVTFANQAFCRVFGATPEAIAGVRFVPVVLAVAHPATITGTKRVELVETDNGPRWYEWTVNRLPGSDTGAGRDEHQTIGRDVTEQREYEARLAEARVAAEAANGAKSRFLAAMSHEIRTPMNGVLGLARLLKRTSLSGEQRKFVDGVLTSGEHLMGLIEEILDFSRIEAGRVVVRPSQFDPAALVSEVVALLQPRAEAKGLAIKVDCAGLPDIVEGDRAKVRQIVINLLDNAIKFTAKGGAHVNVTAIPASAGRARLVLEVTDTGRGLGGIGPDRMFREFEQAGESASDGIGGVGLGLAICRGLARAMGGDIVARDAPGGGAILTATFEVGSVGAERPDTATRRATDGAGPARRSGPVSGKVLIVEDNGINAMVARTFVERLGLTADVVGDGETALAYARQAASSGAPLPLAVLIDLRLPDIDGYQVLAELRRLWSRVPVHLGGRQASMIALTANAFPEDRARCMAAEFDAYLAKPFDPDELAGLLLKGADARTLVEA